MKLRFDLAFAVACCAGMMALAAPGEEPAGVNRRAVSLFSDGTRLAGDVFRPADRETDEPLPGILLCHGWGGKKSHLNETYAPEFAAAGFVVLTFDYRGWGESDGRLVVQGEIPETDEKGEALVRVQVIRDLVDPFDQLEDIQAALNFLEGEPGVDRDRIGIWGSSLGGGLVVWTAAHDDRIRTVVSQVGALDGSWAAQETEGGMPALHEREIRRARGELAPVPVGENVFEGLRGSAYMSKMARFRPIEHVDKLRVPTLFIDAENEEYFDIRQHSGLAYRKIKDRVPSKYHIEPGISHYGIYRERLDQGIKLAIEWFNTHLKRSGTSRDP